MVEQLFRKHRQAGFSAVLSTETAGLDPISTQHTQQNAQRRRAYGVPKIRLLAKVFDRFRIYMQVEWD